VLVDGSGSLRPQVAVENGEVKRVDTVGAVYAAESHAASYVLGIVVSHVSMIVALEAESLPKGNFKVSNRLRFLSVSACQKVVRVELSDLISTRP
jgi:hypothetical protein